MFGFIYTFGYFFLAVVSTGGGHGNYYILLPLIPWLLLFVAIFLFGKLNEIVSRIIFVLVMITHYGIILLFLFNYDFTEDKGWTNHYFPYAAVLWYLLGQLIIWSEFFNEIFLKVKKPAEKI